MKKKKLGYEKILKQVSLYELVFLEKHLRTMLGHSNGGTFTDFHDLVKFSKVSENLY